ncbi:MAG: sulfatase-like hydrolase/transferase [Acidobacteriota bacterium]
MGFASRHRAEPLFLWLHYFDPHTSYVPPEPWIALAPAPSSPGTPIPSRADAEPDAIFPDPCRTWLAVVSDPRGRVGVVRRRGGGESHELGRLLRALAAWDMLASSAILLTADHGESLGEHGVYYGHAGLFEPEVRVPMILVGPGFSTAVVARPVAHLTCSRRSRTGRQALAIPLGGDGPEIDPAPRTTPTARAG